MDNPAILAFVPDRRYTAAAAGGAVLFAAVAALAPDAPGRLLFTLAVVALAAYTIGDLVFSPRLVISGEGVRIRSPFARADLRWDEIESIRADTRIRLGLRATTLEIDAGPVLAVLSRRALGADPAEVADLAAALRRPPGSEGGRPDRHHDDDEDGHPR